MVSVFKAFLGWQPLWLVRFSFWEGSRSGDVLDVLDAWCLAERSLSWCRHSIFDVGNSRSSGVCHYLHLDGVQGWCRLEQLLVL